MNRKLIVTGLICVIIAIILGAFGAHALKKMVSDEALKTFEVGVRYQFYAAFGMLIFGLNADKLTINWNIFYALILSGVLFFSGSIYFLSLNEIIPIAKKFLGPITPIGGMLQISAWIYLLLSIVRKR